MKINCAHNQVVELHKLVPHPKNPNKHPEDQIKRLAKIIDYQGQRVPIVVSKRSGFITKGHGRLEALKMLGWEKAAVDYQDYDDEAQEYADIVADNAIASWAELQYSQINTDILDLGPELDIEMLGINDFKVDASEAGKKSGASNQGLQKVTFTLSNEQKDILEEALVKARLEEDCLDELNKDPKGNTLAAILKRYVYG